MAVIKLGKYKLVETPNGVANAVEVAVIKFGLYKVDETLVGVVKAVEVAVIKPAIYGSAGQTVRQSVPRQKVVEVAIVVETPEPRIVPITCKVEEGLVVPMPTLPALSIVITLLCKALFV